MIALSSARMSVLRGSSTTVFGDDADADTVAQAGLSVALMPASQASTRSVDQRPQEVEYTRGRAPYGTDIRVGDRLRDELTLEVYVVTGSHQAKNPIMAQDLALDLTRVPTT